MSEVKNNPDLGVANLTSQLTTAPQTKELVGNTKASERVTSDKTQIASVNARDPVEKTPQEPLTPGQLEKVAQQLQEFVGKMNSGLAFSVDEDSGRDVIKVIDKPSGEVIKQYPSEEVLSLVAKLSEATGNFIDSTV
jgi:flagellar protein FlaG